MSKRKGKTKKHMAGKDMKSVMEDLERHKEEMGQKSESNKMEETELSSDSEVMKKQKEVMGERNEEEIILRKQEVQKENKN